jgi:glycerate kinase
VIDAVGLAARCDGADLVITGEGSFDWQSLRGKVLLGVTAAAQAWGCPVLVMAGRIEVGRRDWQAAGVAGAYSMTAAAGDASMTRAREVLTATAARAARSWSR